MTWTNKTKDTAETPTLKTKISTKIEKGRILTPDGNQVFVGLDCNFLLVWQNEISLWASTITKIIGETWSNKTKTPIT